MAEYSEIKIDIQSETYRFKEHLNTPKNNRIIFSGMFGIGKTYFLNLLFSEDESYEPFFISPINYSVSNNEDILEYIKYDILINLLEKDNISWEKVTFSDDLLVQYYLKDNFWKLASDVIKHVGKVGKAISTVISDLEKHKTKYEEFKKASETDDLNAVGKFLSDLQQKEGSIYENNDVTSLIYTLVKSILGKKQPILVIDDLDRIDPEHIFRILNVFSAHFSKDNESHKFGFEKVILVCDLNNIRNLFQHKYGSGVDFSGYIDKFYSIAPFHYDNKKEIISRIDNFSRTIKREDNNNEYFKFSAIVLKMMVEYDLINLRKFVDKTNTYWEIPFRKYHEVHIKMRDSSNLIDFLLFMFGNSKEDLCNCLKSRKDEIILERNEYNCFRFICVLLNREKYDKRGEISYINEELDFKINYTITDAYSYEIDIKLEDSLYLNGGKRETIPFFQLLSIAIENYCEITNRYKIKYL